jgi:hypothetical protein
LEKLTFSIFFKISGKSEANSGPFLILTENRFSKFVESHCMNPGKRTISKFETGDFFNIFEVIVSVKNADIDIGAFKIFI